MNRIIIALFLMVTIGCKTPQMYVTPELQLDSETFLVKGRQGLQIGRRLSFGEFTTDKVKQGWMKGYDIPFFLRFQGMKEKLSFQQFGKSGQVADVYCIGKFRSIELEGLKDYFNITLNKKNHFAGTVIVNGGREVWEFLLFNPDGKLLHNTKAGLIRKDNDFVEVNGIKKLENVKNNFTESFWGYEFIYRGQAIGAVETVNNGRVWVKNGLTDDMKLVLASLSSSLLLRTKLEERIE